MNLLLCIYHLGLKNGLRYWSINRFYSKYPDELERTIDAIRKRAVLEPEFPWNSLADDFQRSLDKWKEKNLK